VIDDVLGAYRGKRVLVTGATGFVGSHLLNALSSSAAEVAVLTRDAGISIKRCRVFAGKLSDRNFVKKAVLDYAPNIVFHLAASRERDLTREAFGDAIETNLVGTLNLLFAALDTSFLERIVILGTAEEYGRNSAPFTESMRELPISAYSFSKQCTTHLSELMASSFGLPVVILRPSVAYGPAQRADMFLPALIQTLLRGEEFPMTPGEQTRDYVYVLDVVSALLKAGTSTGAIGEIINIGSGEPIQIAQLVSQVERLLGIDGLVRRGALAYRTGEAMAYWLDISKARRLLGWTPQTPLEEGLANTIDWYRCTFG
jgi:UDP-glucose 4-epimerase